MSRVEKLPTPNDERFRKTFFLVEATAFEKDALWSQWQNKISWEHDASTWLGAVGTIAGRPIYVSVLWARIGNQLVAFWEPTGKVADYDIIAAWFAKHCNPPDWDNSRRTKCDAANFHQCI